MRIKKMYQGGLPENKILNVQSESSTDTYSCDYINNLNFSVDELDELPVDSIVEYAGTDVPDGWELVTGSDNDKINYIQCSFTEAFWVPDTNYKLLTFDNIRTNGDLFSYDSETNEVVVSETASIDEVKLHFHTMVTAGGELSVDAIEVLIYKNDAIATIINDGLDTASSRSATSLDYIVDCAPGDRFRVEARSYNNTYQMLTTYGRTAFIIEEIANNNIGDISIEEKQPSAITAVYDPAVAGTSGNWTLPETNVSTDYPINSVTSQTGTGLTLDVENNCITVGKGISTVLVFTKVTYVTNQSGSDKTWATYITKNRANYSQATFTPTVNVHNNINNSVILNVEEGDQIRIAFYGQAGDLVGRVTNTNISVVELTNNTVVSEGNNEVVLYDNEEGTNGEVTLSDSVANYRYIEIFHMNTAKKYCASQKIYNANNRGVDMQIMITADAYNIYFQTCRANIVNNKITPTAYGNNWWKISSGTINVDTATNSVYIYRVVGYN